MQIAIIPEEVGFTTGWFASSDAYDVPLAQRLLLPLEGGISLTWVKPGYYMRHKTHLVSGQLVVDATGVLQNGGEAPPAYVRAPTRLGAVELTVAERVSINDAIDRFILTQQVDCTKLNKAEHAPLLKSFKAALWEFWRAKGGPKECKPTFKGDFLPNFLSNYTMPSAEELVAAAAALALEEDIDEDEEDGMIMRR